MLSLLSMHNYKKFIPKTFNIILIQHLFLKRVTCKMCFLVKTNIHKYLIIRPKLLPSLIKNPKRHLGDGLPADWNEENGEESYIGGSEVSGKASNFFRPKMQTQLSENLTEA